MGDSMQPSFVTVDVDGRYGVDLEGHVSASGIDLPAGTSATPPNDSRLRWLRELDDDVVAELFAFENVGRMGSLRVPGQGGAAGTNVSAIEVVRSGGASAGEIMARVPGGSRSVLNDYLGTVVSQFLLRADGSSNVGIDWGSTTITGNGANFKKETKNHLLGVTPEVVVAMVNSDTPGFLATGKPIDDDEFELAIAHRLGTNFNTTHTVYWAAIA